MNILSKWFWQLCAWLTKVGEDDEDFSLNNLPDLFYGSLHLMIRAWINYHEGNKKEALTCWQLVRMCVGSIRSLLGAQDEVPIMSELSTTVPLPFVEWPAGVWAEFQPCDPLDASVLGRSQHIIVGADQYSLLTACGERIPRGDLMVVAPDPPKKTTTVTRCIVCRLSQASPSGVFRVSHEP